MAKLCGIAERKGRDSLNGGIDDLTPAIHAVVRINAMWTEGRTIDGVLGELRLFKAIGSTAETAAAFGLLTFWIGHL